MWCMALWQSREEHVMLACENKTARIYYLASRAGITAAAPTAQSQSERTDIVTPPSYCATRNTLYERNNATAVQAHAACKFYRFPTNTMTAESIMPCVMQTSSPPAHQTSLMLCQHSWTTKNKSACTHINTHTHTYGDIARTQIAGCMPC